MEESLQCLQGQNALAADFALVVSTQQSVSLLGGDFFSPMNVSPLCKKSASCVGNEMFCVKQLWRCVSKTHLGSVVELNFLELKLFTAVFDAKRFL